ncbi:hypothetical protein ACFQLX_05860 [Streptomyces polyrhachis]|uniref:Secreted protein n=1 Tax=Streptomyces polyrhachis TaxID=1282885 RepID=A0ABW2GCF4_9ACTN
MASLGFTAGVKRVVTVFAAGAAALTLAAPASAAPFPATTWKVTPTSPTPLPVKMTNSGNVVWTLGAFQLTCTSATVTGSFIGATGNPAQIGTFTAGTWGPTCTSPLGPFSLVHVGGWKIWAKSYDPVTGVTDGYINNVTLNWTGGSMKFTVIGKMSVKYTNSTGALAVTPLPGELSVINPVNCGALFTTATKPTLKATYLVKVTNTTTIPKIVGS